MITRRFFLALPSAGVVAMPWPFEAWAESFPSQSIHFIVPLAASGSADLLARLVGQHLSQRWNQSVVVDMRPGGATIIGSNLVARAPADGYTILFSSNSLVINTKLHVNLPYDGFKAFEPVALMANSPQVLAVRSDSPHQTFKAWLAGDRANPRTLSLASLGPNTTQHMAIEMLQHMTGVKFIYAPFSGGALAVNATLGGHVGAVLGNLAEVSPHIDNGSLRALAVTTKERLDALKQVPTIAESGYPAYEAVAWFGVSAPAGTPHDIIKKLAEGVNSALKDASIRQQLLLHGLQPAYLGPKDYADHIANQYEHYSHIIDDIEMRRT